MNIDHLSVSRVQVFKDTCQYKYKLRYHLKVPSPVETPHYFTYGKVIHSIIEEYTKNKGMLLVGDIATEVLNSYPTLPYYYKVQLKEDINSFKTFSDKLGYKGEIEMQFNKDLEPPNNKIMTGVIDRLVEKQGIYYIVDWKTTKEGEWQKTEDTIITDLQLQVYAHIVSSQMNIPAEKIRCCLYYLRNRKLVPASFCQQTLDSIPSRMLSIYNEIHESNPDTVIGTTGKHCKLCDYRSMCPFYKAM